MTSEAMSLAAITISLASLAVTIRTLRQLGQADARLRRLEET